MYVRVRAAGEHYALPVDDVFEVLEPTALAPVPGAPREIEGICNLRGHVLPVVALSRLLGLSDETSTTERVVVTETACGSVGLSVDQVIDIGLLPEAREGAKSDFLSGAVLLDGALVGILDLERVMAAVQT
jgi:purine-binding chemotaxis protein CheW